MPIRIREELPVYSHFFRTEYDEQQNIGVLEAHCSILSVPSLNKKDAVLDVQRVAVIWDEDHDERVIPILEAACFKGLLRNVLFIAEHKGAVSIIMDESAKSFLRNARQKKWQEICDEVVENDEFSADVMSKEEYVQTLVDSLQPMYENYLNHICDVWSLGPHDFYPAKPRKRIKRTW
ncbi:hypothetical protein EQ832_12125 [Pseudomonas sp. ALS1131]|nr:hypothetical protein [Pseudomonas sp. ALS1131]TRO38593.1 hypothetical protein EQ832_12125 [Pseudomonas sp. ALS1131]